MTEDLSSDLTSLIQAVKKDSIENYSTHVTSNTKGEGAVGEVLFIKLTDKKTGEVQAVTVKQQKIINGKPMEFAEGPFRNEIYFYETVWPTLHEFYHKKTKKTLDFIPKCLGTSKGKAQMIAMENLKALGFDTYDKTKSFTEDHLSLIFKTYGILHGISMSFKEYNGEEFFQLVNSIEPLWLDMCKEGGLLNVSFVSNARELQTLFETVTEKHFIDKLIKFQTDGSNDICKLLGEESVSRVITHGDCWSNNLMFRYNVSVTFIYYISYFNYKGIATNEKQKK